MATKRILIINNDLYAEFLAHMEGANAKAERLCTCCAERHVTQFPFENGLPTEIIGP